MHCIRRKRHVKKFVSTNNKNINCNTQPANPYAEE